MAAPTVHWCHPPTIVTPATHVFCGTKHFLTVVKPATRVFCGTKHLPTVVTQGKHEVYGTKHGSQTLTYTVSTEQSFFKWWKREKLLMTISATVVFLVKQNTECFFKTRCSKLRKLLTEFLTIIKQLLNFFIFTYHQYV